MAGCQQTKGQSVLEHGEAVAAKFKELLQGSTADWRLPAWFIEHGEFLKSKLPDLNLIETYQIYHDCGKPFCQTVDEDGRTHFPNHAVVSEAIWNSIGGDRTIGTYIRHDMDLHLLKPSEAHEYKYLELLPTLLLTALSELHANAEMFGGIESESFKIKFKRLSKTGNILIQRYKEQAHV